jgi:hypothetical protein
VIVEVVVVVLEKVVVRDKSNLLSNVCMPGDAMSRYTYDIYL